MGEEKNMYGEPSIPNLYANIPAAVRYDPHLKPNAKLIYGEISALASAYGYCWASNRYFAENYGFARKTVSALINDLAERGYITVEVIKAPSGQVDMRKIWVNASFAHAPSPIPQIMDGYPLNNGYPIPQKKDTPPLKKGYPIPQIVKENNTSINNNPPTPQGDAHSDAHFDAFWTAYPRKVDKQRAHKAFKRLHVTEALLELMLGALSEQKNSKQWTKDGGAYIPHPTTWLNNSRWETGSGDGKGTPSSIVVESEDIEKW